jgi:aspartyl-tRNA(Asn)/glutamyl-tRNA(Gln) amidotransferase subunit C
MTLTLDQIHKLAALARLKLTEEEGLRYVDELSAILGYVEQLSEVDTEGLLPTAQVTGLVNVVRQDVVVAPLATPEMLLRESARTQDGYVVAPRMLA